MSAWRGLAVKEDPQPVDVVDRIQQRLDLPFVTTVRSRIDVTDMDRAPQAPHTPRQFRSNGGQRLVGLADLSHDQLLAS
jgi:hypothetical protein